MAKRSNRSTAELALFRHLKGPLKHVGAEAMAAERETLLSAYSKAKLQSADDAVSADHGNVAEAVLRGWLEQFLPRRYGVTKGYIITPQLSYQGPLEEWDIVVYDQLNAPVLFVRDNANAGTRRAIPVEHVRGIVEVKAALHPKSAAQVHKKLAKLRHFCEGRGSPTTGQLVAPFVCTAVFFETSVADYLEYRSALNKLSPLAKLQTAPFGFLVLRSQTTPEHAGYLQFLRSERPLGWEGNPEVSAQFRYPDGGYGCHGSFMAWNVNFFAHFIFDLLAGLRGTLSPRIMSSPYGINMELYQGSWLFPRDHRKSGRFHRGVAFEDMRIVKSGLFRRENDSLEGRYTEQHP